MEPPEAQEAFLDAAMQSALGATYLPKVVDRAPLASKYIFHVTYNP